MARLGNFRHTSISELGSDDHASSLFGSESAQDLPPRSVVYSIDRSALGYGEHWMFHRDWRVLGAWWRKLTGFGRRGSERVVHIEDYRAIEITKDDLPAGVQSAIFPLVEESRKLGFCDFRYGRYFDPFNRLEFITLCAVHPEKSAVLRISRKRDMDGCHTLEQEIEISTVFSDGSVLVTTNEQPRLLAPIAEKRQVRKNGGPRELWSSHTRMLEGISFRPKPTPNADAAWDLTNEVDSERMRFHFARGFYAERSLIEYAKDALQLLRGPECSRRVEAIREERGSVNCSFFSIAQLSGAAAVAMAICIVSANDKPSHTMPPLTASQKRHLAQKGQVKAQARLSRSPEVDLRDSK